MSSNDDDCPGVRNFKAAVVSGLKKRFDMESDSMASHPFIVCTVLDPMTKHMTSFPPTVRVAAYDHVRGLIKDALVPRPAPEATLTAPEQEQDLEVQEPPPKRPKTESNRAATMRFLREATSDSNDATAIREPINDFDGYLAAPVAVNDDTEVLDWWKHHQFSYPGTATVARQFLAIPATSVASERLFSATGRLISKLRSRLLPETAEMLVFLNRNSSLVWTPSMYYLTALTLLIYFTYLLKGLSQELEYFLVVGTSMADMYTFRIQRVYNKILFSTMISVS
jgi:hypothetical protein